MSRGEDNDFPGKKLFLGIVIVITLIGILSWGAVAYATDESGSVLTEKSCGIKP